MDCQICNVRSSVGYCVECQKILCESCGVACENCNKLSCPDHIHETSTGRALCKGCYEERREKRKQMKAAHAKKSGGDTSLEGLDAEAIEGGDVGDEALVISARRPLQPWQMSLYIAIGGIVIALLALAIPALRRIPTGGDSYFPSSYLFLIIPVLGIIWAFVGLIKEDYYEDRTKCFYGLGTSVVAVILTVLAIVMDPGQSQTDTGLEDVRPNMTEDELQQWREDTLNQYER
jgi:hypothetical protein